ncbi:hypothetical protein ACET3Z_004989 [Daucus carota]
MSSNCDSDGCPIDHDGFKLEDGVFSSAAPFAIRGDVFRDIMSGSSKDTKGSHLEVDALDLGNRPLFQSSSGGIPLVEQVEVEEDDSDGTISPSTAREMCGSDLSATVQAVLRSSKHEREELYAARNRLMKFQSFIKSKGFSEADVLGSESGEYFSKTLERDEFGLPKLVASPTPSIGARKEQEAPVVPETVTRHDAEGPSLKTPVEATPSKIVKAPTGNTPLVKVSPSADMDLSDASATPSNAFKNLRKVDECDNKHTTSTGDNEQPFQLSKHQKKRLRKAQRKSPPPST